MTANAFFSLGSKALVADGSPGARAELIRRGRCPDTGKKAKAGEATKPAAAKPAAKPAPAPEAAPAPTGERLFANLDGLERHRALKAEAKRLGLGTSGKAAELEARIRAAAPAPAPEAAPAAEGEVDVEAVVEGVKALVDETLRLRAEVASLKAKAATSTGTNRWAAIATQLARAGV